MHDKNNESYRRQKYANEIVKKGDKIHSQKKKKKKCRMFRSLVGRRPPSSLAPTRLHKSSSLLSSISTAILYSRFSLLTLATLAAATMSSLSNASTAAPQVAREGNTIVIRPPSGTPHTASVVGPVHGLGDSANGWLEPALLLARRYPYIKFILPNAPVAPVTLNGGMRMPSWYDIAGLEKRSNEPCTGIDESRAKIKNLLQTERDAGLTPDRILLMGFSQGGAMSLFTGLQHDEQLAGLIVLSGYLAGASKFKLNDAAVNTPVLHCHGTADPMVKIQSARETKEHIVGAGHKGGYDLREFAGLQHEINQEEFGQVAEWLGKHLPPKESTSSSGRKEEL